VQSFARPGGSMTGVSLFTLALVGKRLELLKEILPSARRVALIANPQHPGEAQELDAAQGAAAKLGLAVRYFPVNGEAELDAAFADIARQRDDAIVAFADGFTMTFASRIAAFSLQHRIPAIDGWAEFAQQGNLLIYGPVIEEVHRRLAAFVDKIGRGAKPADLPVELPTKLELVVNMKTARAIGLAIPKAVLLRADQVIG
jgi:putative ABC transport system substrate-binding protein